MTMPQRHASRLLVLSALAVAAQAHLGSPDVYLEGNAGSYQLFVTIRPPVVIPGVAELEVRSSTPGLTSVQAVPLPMSGPGAKFAPVPDKLLMSPQDKQLFTGSLWMMAPGSWQVRLSVYGARGAGTLAIPMPSAALLTKRMQFGLGAILSGLGLFLVAGVIVMAGASVREAKLDPGVIPGPERKRAAQIAMSIAAILVIAALWGGNRWWNNEATSYGQEVYKPLVMRTSLTPNGVLTLNLTDPGWLDGPGWRPLFTRSVDDFVPDHNHLMHLYAIRQGLDVVYHLHPDLAGPGVFRLNLPEMPAGVYRLYADVVHANGFPETLASSVSVPSLKGRPLAGDDASGSTDPLDHSSSDTRSFTLPDGYTMHWLAAPASLHAKNSLLFRFSLTKPDNAAPSDMAFYMGMLGHAAFVKIDGSVFAHIHPSGSVSMAALMLAQAQTRKQTAPETQSKASTTDVAGVMKMPGMDMSGMDMTASAASGPLSNEVNFPYGFPSPGHYRIFVQMKHGQTIETGIFNATVF